MTTLQRLWRKAVLQRKHNKFLHALARSYMRLCGCVVPKSCSIIGLPNLSRHEGEIILGERVFLNSVNYVYRYSFCPKTKLATSGKGKIYIGDDAGINGVTISAENEVRIGSRVMLAPGVIIFDSITHPIDAVPRRYLDTNESAPVIIEDDAWLSMNVIVLPGAHIGQGSVIGVGSIVNGTIPPYTVAVGQPARPIRLVNVE